MGSHKIVLIIAFSGSLLFSCSGTGSREVGNATGESIPGAPVLEPHVESMDPLMHESSGLIYYKGKLWTINDSGGDPILVGMDYNSGRILQGIRIENAKNRDWESLAQDDKFIYICDVGNNFGGREVLKIYRLDKESIPSSGSTTARADIIEYRYAGRSDDNNYGGRSSYDCEAAFVYGDSLYLFTKDWQTRTSTLYTCSTTPGTYDIEARKTYPVDGLITGADYSRQTNSVILCGYKQYIPFVILYEDFNPADYSHGKSHRFDYPDYLHLQTEGIALISPERDDPSSGKADPSPERAIISCERNQYPASLYSLELPRPVK